MNPSTRKRTDMTTRDDVPDVDPDRLSPERRAAYEWAVRTGRFRGRGNGDLDPNGTFTRGDYMLVEYRAAGSPPIDDVGDEPAPEPEPDPELPEPPPTPVDPHPDADPDRPTPGIRSDVADLAYITGKYEPGDHETLIDRQGGYISINGVTGVTIDNYWKAPFYGEATGDGIRIDAYDGNVRDVLLSHLHIGERPNRAPGKHVDAGQAAPFFGHYIENVSVEHCIFEGAANASWMAKGCRGLWEFYNSLFGKNGQHCMRMHADPGHAPTFRASYSIIEQVSLVHHVGTPTWNVDLGPDLLIPGGITVETIDPDDRNRIVAIDTITGPWTP